VSDIQGIRGPEIRTGKDLSTQLTRGILGIWAREGKFAEINVTGVSMAPLIPDRSTLTVRFGRQGLVSGDVVLYQTPEKIIAHRVLRLGRGGQRWGYLKVKGDPLRHGDAGWIPVEDVLGRVVAVKRPDGRTILLNDLTGRIANRMAAAISGILARVEGKSRQMVGASRQLTVTPALLGTLDPLYRWAGWRNRRKAGVMLGREERFLLIAARIYLDEAGEIALSQFLRGEIFWERIVGESASLGLAPLIYRNLSREMFKNSVPSRVLSALARSAHAAACRAAIQLSSLDGILASMRNRGIRPVLLKGAALALTLYDQPALRPMQDIDLLVETGKVTSAVQVLEDLGFSGVVNNYDDGFYAAHHHVRPMIDPGGRVIVEIHKGLVPPEDGLFVDPAPALERATSVDIQDKEYRVLCREDQLLHAALHLSYADRFIGKIRDLLDLDAQATVKGRAFDWGLVVESARSLEVSRSLYSTLDLARRLLGTPVPAAVLTEMRRSAGWDPVAESMLRILAKSSLFRATPSDNILSAPAARWMCDSLIKRPRWSGRLKDLFQLFTRLEQPSA
jgi:hypothetical protein